MKEKKKPEYGQKGITTFREFMDKPLTSRRMLFEYIHDDYDKLMSSVANKAWVYRTAYQCLLDIVLIGHKVLELEKKLSALQTNVTQQKDAIKVLQHPYDE